MTLGDELRNGSLMKRPGDQQDDVVNHVAVSDKVEEGRERLNSMVAQVLEFNHKLFAKLIIDDRHSQWRRFVGEKLSVVSALQMQL